jgi:Fe-S cluster biogenesis protein NfuA
MIQVDGGDVLFEGLSDSNSITLRFRGDCSRCSATGCRLVPWIADRLETQFGRRYQVKAIMDKPYFYR